MQRIIEDNMDKIKTLILIVLLLAFTTTIPAQE
ncbi:MAG: hypothetical protein XE13_0566, partial [Proteiniphilum sp. 51_7]